MFEELKAARTVLLNNLLSQDKIEDHQRKAIEEGNLLVLDAIDFSSPSDKSQKEFLIDLNELEKFPSVQGLNAIVENYISKTAENQININSKLRGDIENAAKDPEKIGAIRQDEYTQSLANMRQKIDTLLAEVEAIPEKSGMLSGMLGGKNTTRNSLVESVDNIKSALEVTTDELGFKNDLFPKAADVSEDSFTQFHLYEEHYESSCANRELESSIETIEGCFEKSKGKAKYDKAKQAFTSFKEDFDKFTSARDALVEHAEELKKQTGHHVDTDLATPGVQSFVDAVNEERKEAQGKDKGREL